MTTVNSQGDSCDFYYNIRKPPMITDSLTGALDADSRCLGAGFQGENIGVYQGVAGVIGRAWAVGQRARYGIRAVSVPGNTGTLAGVIVGAGVRCVLYDLAGRRMQAKAALGYGGKIKVYLPYGLAAGKYVVQFKHDVR